MRTLTVEKLGGSAESGGDGEKLRDGVEDGVEVRPETGEEAGGTPEAPAPPPATS